MKKPTVPEVMPLARAYVAKPGNGVGGSLHIVLEDLNVRDSDVLFCIGVAHEANDVDGAVLGELLLLMSQTQRSKIARNCWYDA